MSTDKNKIPAKIISLLLAQLLLLAGSVPHEPLLENNRYLKNSLYIDGKLRVPMVFSGSSEGKDRMLGLKVMEKIKQFQVRGLAPGTINQYIKKEFEEPIYHLQDRIRMAGNVFYVKAGDEYFEVTSGETKNIDKTTFEQGRRILVKVVSGSYTKEELVAEVKKVTAKLQKKLKRPPNIRETAEAMPSLQTSRNPAALLYKHFQANKISSYDYGISRFFGKANLVIKKSAATEGMSFAFAGTRIFLPTQLSGRIEISAAKTPISKEKKIDLVDRKSSENRLTIEHIPEQDTLRLIYTRPSGEEVISDIEGVRGKTSITLTLNPVFSDFYDTVFSIPLYQGKERLEAVTGHLRNKKLGTYFEQQERHVNFHGHLSLTSFYETHPGRIRIYRDRKSLARFVIFEDMANPGNIVGYEWRNDRIIPLEKGPALEIDSTVLAEAQEIPLYYLNRSGAFKNFDERLNKDIEIMIATPDDTRLSEISLGTGRFSFRFKRNISVFSFEGQRSKENITRDDRSMYPIRIERLDDKSEIRIGYRNPDVQGEFVIEGLNWEDRSPVVLKGPSGYEGKRGYFNISTIIEMLRRDLLLGIEASNWIMETFSFSEGPDDSNLRNPIRSYNIERSASGEKFLVEDVLVDPKTFLPWEDQRASELSTGDSPTKLASNEILSVSGDEGSGQAVVWQPKNILFRTVEGKSVAVVGRLPQATGKEQRIEPKIEYATGKKVLDSSSGLNIAEIEGVNDEFGEPKRFVLKHEISEAMLKRYPSDYTLRDNGERTVFAMNLLRLLLEEEFKEYDVMLPEVLIVEDADSGQRFIATEYIESAKPLESRLLDRDDSRTMAAYNNHELLDVYCGFLLYMDDREFLLKGDALTPFDLETALAPIYYMKNGQIDHGYNASGYFLRGQVSDYKRIAARIKDFMLDKKGMLKADVRKKITSIIKESGLIDNVREIELDGNVLEVITTDKIVSFLEAQANSIEYSIEQANRIPAVMGFVEQIIPDRVTRTIRAGI